MIKESGHKDPIYVDRCVCVCIYIMEFWPNFLSTRYLDPVGTLIPYPLSLGTLFWGSGSSGLNSP